MQCEKKQHLGRVARQVTTGRCLPIKEEFARSTKRQMGARQTANSSSSSFMISANGARAPLAFCLPAPVVAAREPPRGLHAAHRSKTPITQPLFLVRFPPPLIQQLIRLLYLSRSPILARSVIPSLPTHTTPRIHRQPSSIVPKSAPPPFPSLAAIPPTSTCEQEQGRAAALR